MSHSTHSTVGGAKTKITTTTKMVTSSSTSIQKQHVQHEQHQLQRKVITNKPPHKKETEKENQIPVVAVS